THQLRLELRGLQFEPERGLLALLIAVVVAQPVLYAENDPARHEILMECAPHQYAERIAKPAHYGREKVEIVYEDALQRDLADGDHGVRYQVERNTPRPVAPFDRKPAAEPEDHRCRQRTDINAGQPRSQVAPPRRRVVRRELLREALSVEEEAHG